MRGCHSQSEKSSIGFPTEVSVSIGLLAPSSTSPSASHTKVSGSRSRVARTNRIYPAVSSRSSDHVVQIVIWFPSFSSCGRASALSLARRPPMLLGFSSPPPPIPPSPRPTPAPSFCHLCGSLDKEAAKASIRVSRRPCALAEGRQRVPRPQRTLRRGSKSELYVPVIFC